MNPTLAIVALVAAIAYNHVEAAPVESDWQTSLQTDMQQLAAQDSQKLIDTMCAATSYYSAGLVGRITRTNSATPLPSYESVAAAMYEGLLFKVSELDDVSAALEQYLVNYTQTGSAFAQVDKPPPYVSVVASHPQAFSSQPMPLVSAHTISSVQAAIVHSAGSAAASYDRLTNNLSSAFSPAPDVTVASAGKISAASVHQKNDAQEAITRMTPPLLNSTVNSMRRIASELGLAAAWGSIVPQGLSYIRQIAGAAATAEERCKAVLDPTNCRGFMQATTPTMASVQAMEGLYTSTIRPNLLDTYTSQMIATSNGTVAQITRAAFARLIDGHFRQLMLQASTQRAQGMLSTAQFSLCRTSTASSAPIGVASS